jgi:hypothetical protein
MRLILSRFDEQSENIRLSNGAVEAHCAGCFVGDKPPQPCMLQPRVRTTQAALSTPRAYNPAFRDHQPSVRFLR